MDNPFKDHLFKLRNPPAAMTFAEALLGPLARKTGNSAQSGKATPEVSEKRLVLESLERFAVDKLQGAAPQSIVIDGGEIALKGERDWSVGAIPGSWHELRSKLSLAPEILKLLFAKKEPGKVSVLFVTEDFRNWSEVLPDLSGGFVDELLCGFSLKTAAFFERMIQAMKLGAGEVCLYPVESADHDLTNEVMMVAGFFRPEVIITLGAKATQRVLDSKDRLAQIHGQFFQRSLSRDQSFTVVPLFHPNIIESNQNMKKTAWTDMQKIMRHLKKLQ